MLIRVLLAAALGVHAAPLHLPTLEATLKTGDWNDRIEAVHRLGELGAPGRALLRSAADDADWQVRFTAVHWLGRLGPQAAEDLAASLHGEPCRIIRVTAVHWLGSFGPSAAPILESALEDDSAAARAANRYWLRKQGRFQGEPAEPGAIAAEDLNYCASSPTPKRLARGAPIPGTAQSRRTAEDAEAFTVEDMDQEKPAKPAPEDLPAAAGLPERKDAGASSEPPASLRDAEIEVLMREQKRMLEPENLYPPALAPRPAVKKTAEPREALALKRDGVEAEWSARPQLGEAEAPLARPEGPGARTQGPVDGMPAVADDHGAPPMNDPLPELLAALKHPDAIRRSRAADELGALGAQAASAKGPLRKTLKDPSTRVRAAAAAALGKLHDEEAVGPIIKLLRDKNQDVRYSAAEALGRIGSPKARAAFEDWLKDEAKRTSRTAR